MRMLNEKNLGEKVMTSLQEGYSLGDDKESFDVWDEQHKKFREIGDFIKGYGDSSLDKALTNLEHSQDNIYTADIMLTGLKEEDIEKEDKIFDEVRDECSFIDNIQISKWGDDVVCFIGFDINGAYRNKNGLVWVIKKVLAALDKPLNESKTALTEEEKKYRISWGYNRNQHTGDYEDQGSFDIMANDEDDAENKAYKELDRTRTPYDEFWVECVTDADVFGIEYKGQYYKENGLKSNRDPEYERVFVSGSEDEVKSFANKLIGKFIKDRSGAYKCLAVKEVYIAALAKGDNTPDVNDPDVFEKLSGGFKPLDLTHQKEVQDKILKLFRERIKAEHYKNDVSFEMDDTKLTKPGYIGTICIYSWNFTNSDKFMLDEIFKECGCIGTRDRDFEAMSYFCFEVTESGGKE